MKKIITITIFLLISSNLHSQSFVELLNKHRRSLGLSILTVDSTLTKMARHHTAYLTTLRIEPTHDEDIDVDGMVKLKDMNDRFNYYSPEISTTKCWSECVSYFQHKNVQPSESHLRHFKNLLASAPHRKIMEDPVIRKIGLGESFYKYTTIDSVMYNGRLITGKNTYDVYTMTVCFGK